MKRYSASVSHGEVEHEEDDAGMWVFRDDAEQAISEAVAAERERWKAHADAMALSLEAFEAQGSDKTEALRAYRVFRA
jgi:hypothetical protein